MQLRHLLLMFVLFMVFCSCSKTSIKEEIENYLTDNNLTAESTADGLYYIIEVEGSPEKPDLENEIVIHYQGMLTNGTIFDSSYERGEPSTFSLSANLIKGWKLGIPLFGKGGKGTLIIPPSLGYGQSRAGEIPPNSILIFEIELIDFY